VVEKPVQLIVSDCSQWPAMFCGFHTSSSLVPILVELASRPFLVAATTSLSTAVTRASDTFEVVPPAFSAATSPDFRGRCACGLHPCEVSTFVLLAV
jgi:hypothetical protein